MSGVVMYDLLNEPDNKKLCKLTFHCTGYSMPCRGAVCHTGGEICHTGGGICRARSNLPCLTAVARTWQPVSQLVEPEPA